MCFVGFRCCGLVLCSHASIQATAAKQASGSGAANTQLTHIKPAHQHAAQAWSSALFPLHPPFQFSEPVMKSQDAALAALLSQSDIQCLEAKQRHWMSEFALTLDGPESVLMLMLMSHPSPHRWSVL
eukprot:1146364-Pelagomonas_calceolata.AAC.1